MNETAVPTPNARATARRAARQASALAQASLISDPFMRLPAVKLATGLSRSAIYRAIHTRDFPAPVKLGARVSVWRRSDIAGWIERKASRR